MFLLFIVVRTGHKLGWGVHYLEPIECGDGLTVQPLLCCVALNGCFQTSVCYLEPEGGYHPFIAFTSQGIVYIIAFYAMLYYVYNCNRRSVDRE